MAGRRSLTTRSSGPKSMPPPARQSERSARTYSPKCVEEEFSEVRLCASGPRFLTTEAGGPLPLYLVGLSEAVEKDSVQPLPHPGLLPLLQAFPAGHPRAAAHLLGQHLPGDTAL